MLYVLVHYPFGQTDTLEIPSDSWMESYNRLHRMGYTFEILAYYPWKAYL